VWTSDGAPAADRSVEVARFAVAEDELLGRVSGRFGRVETRCWTIAEHAGDPTPGGVQHLLNRARWDTDGIAADLRDYVVDDLGEPDAILVVDETGGAPRGAEVSRGRRSPPSVIAVAD
jgi:SRSO17 transposase